eukprot:Unigene14140_Nuclearia_a/m.42665 Unigene14140_Nuclearia_a/g.42665  ORF Unigene14140_Nuclearia_a/g.42665 Unigene14140_Nuclearia_a/m.42665 type:complete len:381 (+) Unigene14140_Nuclearia_a:1287-2429(+)
MSKTVWRIAWWCCRTNRAPLADDARVRKMTDLSAPLDASDVPCAPKHNAVIALVCSSKVCVGTSSSCSRDASAKLASNRWISRSRLPDAMSQRSPGLTTHTSSATTSLSCAATAPSRVQPAVSSTIRLPPRSPVTASLPSLLWRRQRSPRASVVLTMLPAVSTMPECRRCSTPMLGCTGTTRAAVPDDGMVDTVTSATCRQPSDAAVTTRGPCSVSTMARSHTALLGNRRPRWGSILRDSAAGVASPASSSPAMFHCTSDRSEYRHVTRCAPWPLTATQSGHTRLVLSSSSSARGSECARGSVVTYLKSVARKSRTTPSLQPHARYWPMRVRQNDVGALRPTQRSIVRFGPRLQSTPALVNAKRRLSTSSASTSTKVASR